MTTIVLALGLPPATWPDRLLSSTVEVLSETDLDSHAPTGWTTLDGVTPELRSAIERATAAAAKDGIQIRVQSGHRSAAEQQRIFDFSVAKYGSVATARRWVLPPGESRHVSGQAVDVGLRAGARWLEQHAAEFGLCRRYANEWWHFELIADQPTGECRLEPYASWLG